MGGFVFPVKGKIRCVDVESTPWSSDDLLLYANSTTLTSHTLQRRQAPTLTVEEFVSIARGDVWCIGDEPTLRLTKNLCISNNSVI